MSFETHCEGLPASWINAWLAAVGMTFLDARIRLCWTENETPIAVFSAQSIDPVDALLEVWPHSDFLEELPIAARWRDQSGFERKISIERFIERVQASRTDPQNWSLSSTLTDLSVQKNGEVAHAPFDPAGPGTTKWLHHRVLKMHELVGEATRDRLLESLRGQAPRFKNNGLGFDSSRLGSLADDSEPRIEPVIELLTFFGLAIAPMRGHGFDQRLTKRGRGNERQRGWRMRDSASEGRRFTWPVWTQPLDFAGIDALLDVWTPFDRSGWSRLGIHGGWQSVQYKNRASADTTRAFGAEELD
ncbi:MAG: hypothetical protein OXG05_05075 [Gammaproteobacteria bacterium]|nr:hypothetical protein [Gammaproteobacteria bacterium]